LVRARTPTGTLDLSPGGPKVGSGPAGEDTLYPIAGGGGRRPRGCRTPARRRQ